jgi:hypothetical protein
VSPGSSTRRRDLDEYPHLAIAKSRSTRRQPDSPRLSGAAGVGKRCGGDDCIATEAILSSAGTVAAVGDDLR